MKISVFGALLTIVGIILAAMILYPSAPSAEHMTRFYDRCHDVGFTREQCVFFHYGADQPDRGQP